MRTRALLAAVAAAITVAALTGCTASSGGSSAASVAQADSVTGTAAGSAAKAPAADRAVVTTGSLRLVADHPIRAAGRITDLVEAADGRVARSTQDPSGSASAHLTLRIPAASFPRTLDAIEREGEVRDVQVDATDVTARVTDYGVRISGLRTSIARLQELLSRATSSAALVEIEGALTDRQGTLEQLLAEQRTLTDQVAYSSLEVAVVVPAAAPKQGPADFAGGLVTGFEALVAVAASLAIGAGVLLPWAVVLAALGGAALVVTRRIRRRPTSA